MQKTSSGKFQKHNELESVWFGMAWIFLPRKVISLVIREKMALPSSALLPALGDYHPFCSGFDEEWTLSHC